MCCLALLCRTMTWFIFLFGWTLQIHCFNFLNVHTYHSELTVAPHCKNSTNKIPFLSQKMLPMTLHSETCILNFFCMVMPFHWLSCCQHLFLSHHAGEVLHKCYFEFFVFSAPTLNKLFCSQVLWWRQWPLVFHSLLQHTVYLWIVVTPNQHINTVFGLCRHCCGWSATVGLSPMSFSRLLKQQTQYLTELTSMALSPHTLLRCKWTGMELSAVRNSITTLCLVHISTVLHCCCVEHMGLTAALMILVELDSVTIQWVRQETLPSITFPRKK